jgi:Trypsin-like peptidase domain
MGGLLNSPWNNAVSYLRAYWKGKLLAEGTCFFVREDDRMWLVTNWHNLSGRDVSTGQPRLKEGHVPTSLTFSAFKLTGKEVQEYPQIEQVEVEVKLCEDDFSGAVWLEHAEYGRKADVAALEVTGLVDGTLIKGVNDLEVGLEEEPYVSQEVFILGYPFGLFTGSPSPVWKRGSIAIDPHFDPHDLPKIYVDTATRKGMSGALVLARFDSANGVHKDKVLGIYSGRFDQRVLKAQLGVVWKRHLIFDVILNGKRFKNAWE